MYKQWPISPITPRQQSLFWILVCYVLPVIFHQNFTERLWKQGVGRKRNQVEELWEGLSPGHFEEAAQMRARLQDLVFE